MQLVNLSMQNWCTGVRLISQPSILITFGLSLDPDSVMPGSQAGIQGKLVLVHWFGYFG